MLRVHGYTVVCLPFETSTADKLAVHQSVRVVGNGVWAQVFYSFAYLDSMCS